MCIRDSINAEYGGAPRTTMLAARFTSGLRAASGASRMFSTGGEKLHELRQYVCHTQHLPDYLKLTGSDAFKARTDASPLLGFFLVEMGGQLNRVIHLWEYDSLDHRTEVRKQLAGHEGFANYFGQIRPWLLSQSSVLLKPSVEFNAANTGEKNGAFFCLRSSPGLLDDVEGEADLGDAALVGKWTEVIGENGTEWSLYSAQTYQKLVESEAINQQDWDPKTVLMAPTPFSPMQ
eukprot:TRINITY_DN27293_c0_g1_i1.p1 TRINITY_DN27293_c0_g1~~TRINITY_DN27293_c0_g1_i1.p1  ORF type:complete len:234 (-),score=70.37 TRINITY_DN27293_c0_g1_i1:250-951(-)